MNQDDSDGDSTYVGEHEDSFPELTHQDASSLSPEDNDNDQRREESLADSSRMKESSTRKSVGWIDKKRPARKLLESRNAYRELFNNYIEGITGQHVQSSDRVLEPPSQIGASTWSSREKDVFFRKLPTLGRDNIKEIATAIGSKSESEVHQYIQLLKDGVVEGNLTQDLDVYLATSIPAASEISRDCEAILEAAADVLTEDQRKVETKRELRKHGSYWLLNERVAEEIEETLKAADTDEAANGTRNTTTTADVEDTSADDGSEEEIDLAVPAAGLLDLTNWLELSRLFMWQSHEGSENWTDFVTSKDETPSIYHTAFQDFHNLTVSLTRRLLQASIFQAQSRMRARDRNQGREQQPKVYVTDVQAAARVLDLKANSKAFWRDMPRRHSLKVYVREEKSNRKEQTPEGPAKDYHYGNLYHMTYDEVEMKLGVREEKVEESYERMDDTLEDDSELIEIYDDSDLWTEISCTGDEGENSAPAEAFNSEDEAPDDRTFQPDDNESEVQSHHPPSQRLNTRIIEKQLDMQAEALDRNSSAIEEARLWSLMGIEPPVEIKDEEHELMGALPIKRKTKSEMRDWREWIDYESEWERETGLASKEEFLAMETRGAVGRKRRMLVHDAPRKMIRRSSRLGADNSNIYGSSDDEEDEGIEPPSLPQPAEHIGVVWPMHPVNPVENIEPGEERQDSHATTGASGSPESQRAQSTGELSTQMIAALRRKSMATASRAASTRSQTPNTLSRRPSLNSQASESSAPAESFLKALSRDRGSTSRRATPSNTGRRPSETDAAPGAEQDVEMDDASDADSTSSSDIDTTRKPVQRQTSLPLSKSAVSGLNSEENSEDEGWMGTIARAEKAERAKARE